MPTEPLFSPHQNLILGFPITHCKRHLGWHTQSRLGQFFLIGYRMSVNVKFLSLNTARNVMHSKLHKRSVFIFIATFYISIIIWNSWKYICTIQNWVVMVVQVWLFLLTLTHKVGGRVLGHQDKYFWRQKHWKIKRLLKLEYYKTFLILMIWFKVNPGELRE